MNTFKRTLVLAISVVTVALAVAPVSYAGEDCADDESCNRGGSDTGGAAGGAATGFGAMASSNQDGTSLAIGLAGGGVLILTAAGLVSRRREIEVGA